ncbi:heterokaryon incompatibility protein-domain-containing protein [Xylaria sp. FL1777]|nr:heterokaryon incompatibility protein-domain-containing protein [Xylaria sp. FL1777]
MDLATSLPYRGHLLDQDDSIRLAYLEPGQKNDTICISLGNARLSDSPPYEALSYTWGDASQTTTIQISSDLDGPEPTAHSVTVNCCSALQRLRRAGERRALWIDAICINQESTAERNHQLGLMADIYAKASRVVVYLGEGDEYSDAAMDVIASILDPPDYKSTPSSDYNETTLINILSTASDKCVASLFRRPWFSRIWVLQEIANAQSATAYCGGRELPWESFRDFVHYNTTTKWIKSIPFAVEYSARESPPCWTDITQRLLGMLIDTRSYGATDPRDKVFALIPLLAREQRLLRAAYPESSRESSIDVSMLLPDILLNYDLSPCDVFISLAVYFLRHLGLGILRHVTGSSSHLRTLPSWVPDWSLPSNSKYRQIPISARAPRDASPVWDYRFSPFHELQVNAVNCGVVETIGGLCDIDNDRFPISQWQQLVLQECHEDLSFKRLIVGKRLVYEDVVEEVLDRISRYESDVGDTVRNSRGRSPGAPNSQARLRNVIVSFGPGSYERQASWILETCDMRRIFVANDRKIGLASGNAKEGDIIFSIKGVVTPFLLRKSTVDSEMGNNYYTLVGECYLLGVKEAKSESELETIVII